jgi:hypothetical protein
MLDERAFAVVLMLISVALGYLGYVALGGVLPGVICLVVAAMIAAALWTPLRGYLGIPSCQSAPDALPLVDRLRLALSEGVALTQRLDPTTPLRDVLQTARAWQDATYKTIASERRDLAERFLDAGEPIEERETQSLATVNTAHWSVEAQTTVLKEFLDELDAAQ